MNVKLRTRNSPGRTGISHCNTTTLVKIITALNNNKNLSITDLWDKTRGASLKQKIKGG